MSILAISSQVVRGHVGNSAAVPVLTAMGLEVWPLPTVLLSQHPGHGRPAGRATAPGDMAAIVDSLAARGWLARVHAVMTGYFATPAQVEVAAKAIARLRAAADGPLTVLVDPIIGDDGRVYVGAGVPEAIRDLLLPLADIATPNLFELGWLVGQDPAATDPPVGADAAAALARTLGPAEVVVTSVPGTAPDTISTLAIMRDGASDARHDAPLFAHVPNGLGDTLAAAYLGCRLREHPPATALARAGAAVASLAAASAQDGLDELPLTALRSIFQD